MVITTEKRLKDYKEDYGFETTAHGEEILFSDRCVVYQTKYKDIYITDYDFSKAEAIDGGNCCELIYKGGKWRNSMTVSTVSLECQNLFNEILDDFKKECDSLG